MYPCLMNVGCLFNGRLIDMCIALMYNEGFLNLRLVDWE